MPQPAPGAQAPPEPAPPPPCERCGTFAELHAIAGRRLCTSCLDRVHAIERAPMTVGAVLSGVLDLLKRIGLPASVLLVLVDLPIGVAELWLQPPGAVSNVYNLLVSIVAQGAVLVMAHGAVTGESPVGMLPALGASLRRWPSLVWTQLLVNVVTVFGALLCLIPGIIAALGFTAVLPVVLHERGSGSNVLRTSWDHMKGHKGAVFAAYLVAAIPIVVFVGVFAVSAAVAVLGTVDEPAAAERSSPAYLAAEAAFTLLVPAFVTPIALVPAVVYAKLRAAVDARNLTGAFEGLGLS